MTQPDPTVTVTLRREDAELVEREAGWGAYVSEDGTDAQKAWCRIRDALAEALDAKDGDKPAGG